MAEKIISVYEPLIQMICMRGFVYVIISAK